MKFTNWKISAFLFFTVGVVLLLQIAPPSSAQTGYTKTPRIKSSFRVIGCVSGSGATTASTSDQDSFYIKGIGRLVLNLPLAAQFQAALVEDCNALRQAFGVNAPMVFVEEEDRQPNAMATDLVIDNNRPDGTVFFGVQLLQSEYRDENGRGWGIPSVIAHEFAHVMQYKYKFPDMNSKWQELHADYMSGWFTAHKARFRPSIPMASLQTIFNKGDYAFNDEGHHGMPVERGSAFQAGYNLNLLNNVSSGAFAYTNGLNYIMQQGAGITKAPAEGDTGNPQIPYYVKRKRR
jgi:hypothetical protein